MAHPWLVKNTARKKGRNLVITPRTSDTTYLSVGRVVLDQKLPNITIEPDDSESAYICLHGAGKVHLDGRDHTLKPYDGFYVPRGMGIDISAEPDLDLVEMRAPVDHEYPAVHVPFEQIQNDPSLSPQLGGHSCRRTVHLILGPNVKTGRLLAGVTIGDAGNWTSWPPHEHADIQEEVYLYFDIPAPGYGLQLIYTDPEEIEFLSPVRSDDACIMPRGFHPNVAAPGYKMNFVWVLCGYREQVDREWGRVTLQQGLKEVEEHK
ncbi:5-deoxy-glucuronate isomerase [candidate division KSB1 bacterium]